MISFFSFSPQYFDHKIDESSQKMCTLHVNLLLLKIIEESELSSDSFVYSIFI